MHGFNHGSHTVRDLALSRQPLQEHWLTPANLDKLHELFPQYLCFCSSAMRSAVESGPLYFIYYAALLRRRGGRILRCTLSVRLSVFAYFRTSVTCFRQPCGRAVSFVLFTCQGRIQYGDFSRTSLFIYLFAHKTLHITYTYVLPCTKRAGQQGTDNRH